MQLVAVMSVLVACGSAPIAPARTVGAGSAKPRLVVLLVIDQLPQWAFAAKRPHLTGGFDRLLRQGAWSTGQHPSAATLTAPGHALLGTGEPPATSGIIANEWWQRDGERMVKSVEDPAGGVSAHHLRVPGLADAVAAARSGGKAVSVSLKDRAAVLTLGHAGIPIWYDRIAVAFVTTSPLPWLAEHGRAHPISAHLQEVWTPLDAAKLARLSGTIDAQRGEVGSKGFDATFPHPLGGQALAVFAAPIGNELVFETALAAIDGEQLGRDAAADLLVVSLSAHDFVGHGWGHESWEAWDMMLRLDEQLGRFLTSLDAKLGAGTWAMVVTSDHGGSPLPERMHGGRITFESLQDAANRAASTELGAGTWIASAKYPSIYLTAAARAKPVKERARALEKIMSALRSVPGIERVGRTADHAGDCERRTGEARGICLMLDPERSGELFYLPRAGWVLEKTDERLATAHGSFLPHDREVPVIIVPAGGATHPAQSRVDPTTIDLAQIATIVAGLLHVTPPSALPRR